MEQNFLDVTPSNLDTKAVLECIRGFREMCNGQGVEHAAELNEKVEAVARENAKLLVDIEKGHATNKQLQNELHLLQAADRKAQSIIENMQNSNRDTILENIAKYNEKSKQLAVWLQSKLDVKLKLTQSSDDSRLWTARFFFDRNESHKQVTILCDFSANSYALVDMSPKPGKFYEMTRFLARTNDISGFMASCWEYFQDTY